MQDGDILAIDEWRQLCVFPKCAPLCEVVRWWVNSCSVLVHEQSKCTVRSCIVTSRHGWLSDITSYAYIATS